jgi:hypothetical protein
MGKITRLTNDGKWVFGDEDVPSLFGDKKIKLALPPQTRRVLVIGNGNVFDDGIMDLLGFQPDLRLIHATYLSDAFILVEVIQHRPDVMVLISSRSMNLDFIVNNLLSDQVTRLRLVILSLEMVQIQIYEKEDAHGAIKSTRILPIRADDFLQVVNKGWHDMAPIQHL